MLCRPCPITRRSTPSRQATKAALASIFLVQRQLFSFPTACFARARRGVTPLLQKRTKQNLVTTTIQLAQVTAPIPVMPASGRFRSSWQHKSAAHHHQLSRPDTPRTYSRSTALASSFSDRLKRAQIVYTGVYRRFSFMTACHFISLCSVNNTTA